MSRSLDSLVVNVPAPFVEHFRETLRFLLAGGGAPCRAMDARSRSCHGGVKSCLEVRHMAQSVQPMACPDCHALTDDLAAHERWHSRLVHDIAVAVDNENKRREAAMTR